MTRVLASLAVLAALITIAGCGGDDERQASSRTPSATTTQAADTAATTSPPSDRAQSAQAIASCVKQGAGPLKVSDVDVLTGETPAGDEEAASLVDFNASRLAKLAGETGDGAVGVSFVHGHKPDNPYDDKDAGIEVFVFDSRDVAIQQALDLARKNPGIEDSDVVVVSQNALIFEADDEHTSDQERDLVLGCVPAPNPKTPAELADKLPIDPQQVGSCLSDRYGEAVIDWNDPGRSASPLARELYPYLSRTPAEPDAADLNGQWTIEDDLPSGRVATADIYLYRNADLAELY